jgi:glycogen debranching enzyme
MSAAQRDLEVLDKSFPHMSSSNSRFNDWIGRSISDVQMMVAGNPEVNYPYAGVPWFGTVFGRDGIITALQTLWLNPAMARGVLECLAATQADRVEEASEAEPGKILHEMRCGEMAALGEVPFGRYYGSVDATPLFIILARAYFERTADCAFIQRLWPHIERALTWIDEFGDLDGDGFVEYRQRSAKGLVQQGWKDSNDSIFHADGKIAPPPIALCEVQGYVYAAKLAAAFLSRFTGSAHRSASLEVEAENLRARFEEQFWCVPRMPDTACIPESHCRNELDEWLKRFSDLSRFLDGAYARWRLENRVTTRFLTTTDRSGRMTTLWSQADWLNTVTKSWPAKFS